MQKIRHSPANAPNCYRDVYDEQVDESHLITE